MKCLKVLVVKVATIIGGSCRFWLLSIEGGLTVDGIANFKSSRTERFSNYKGGCLRVEFCVSLNLLFQFVLIYLCGVLSRFIESPLFPIRDVNKFSAGEKCGGG